MSPQRSDSNNVEDDPQFEALLEYLKRSRGIDFTGYKRTTLTRRVAKRLQMLGIDNYADYVDFLQAHPDEFVELFNTILINVTSFFRDRETWDYLRDELLPRLISACLPREQIRIWSAGCASGQETYSIAMLLCEALGVQGFHNRVKIYATDIDEEALAYARQAVYSAKEVDDIPADLLEKYFVKSGEGYAFRQDLRRTVIFGRHDLVQDAPISHLDLLVCRNTLMYLNSQTQGRIIARLHFALNDSGCLVLGKAEMLLSHTKLFGQIDSGYRIFSKVSQGTRDRMLLMAQAGDVDALGRLEEHLRLKELASDSCLIPFLVVDSSGKVAAINRIARDMFAITPDSLGRPLQDLEISYRPVELRSLIEKALNQRKPVIANQVTRQLLSGDKQILDVEVAPLFCDGEAPGGALVSFVDQTEFYHLSENTQITYKELDTINQELQSTNEELETTNEELQSTNEELETINEELQSTNEELEATNSELNALSRQVSEANVFLQAILGSVRSGIIVVDHDFKVVAWNERSQDLWGLRSDEVVGQTLTDLDIGLPVNDLMAKLKDFKGAGYSELQMGAVNRRGATISCMLRICPLLQSGGRKNGFVVLVEEQRSA